MRFTSRAIGLFGYVVIGCVTFLANVASGQLGSMHWCDTLCLCDDQTMEKLQCFQQDEFYSLIGLNSREVTRLERANFDMQEKLKWCTDTCLCHKHSEMDFKCTTGEELVNFITHTSPSLVDRLEPVEIYDLRDKIGNEEDMNSTPEEEEEKRPRHQGKKRRKNKKRRKHHKEIPPPEEDPRITSTTPTPTEPPLPPTEDPAVMHAGVFGGSRHPGSKTTPMHKSAELEVPLQRKTMAGEVSEDLQELRDHVDQIKEDVELNQRILLVTVAVAAVAMIGVLILSVYSCCVRKKSNCSRSRKGMSSTPDENSMTKVHLDEAW